MLIYLNGVSSSGKTSVAKEIQNQIKKPILYFSIDTLLYSLAETDLNALMGKVDYRYDLHLNRIYKGYFASLRELVKAGNFVIADCPIVSAELKDHYTEFLDFEKKRLVYLECSLKTLLQREVDRRDRAVGLAKRQFESIEKFIKPDIKILNENTSPEKSALEIISFINN